MSSRAVPQPTYLSRLSTVSETHWDWITAAPSNSSLNTTNGPIGSYTVPIPALIQATWRSISARVRGDIGGVPLPGDLEASKAAGNEGQKREWRPVSSTDGADS